MGILKGGLNNHPEIDNNDTQKLLKNIPFFSALTLK